MVLDGVPRHVAVIPDGNRRYAKARGKLPWEGHRIGADVFRKLTQWCKQAGVKELSFWGASTENLERDKKEVDFLCRLFEQMCDELIIDYSPKGKAKDKVRIRFVGSLDRLPETLKAKMDKVMELTKSHSDYCLNILIGYGGRDEIVKAARALVDKAAKGKLKPEQVDEKVFKEHLLLDSEPDLIIRTSQQRLSGLLPFQSAYSEVIFLEKVFWPEFTEQHFKKCLSEYAKRQRTFGH